MQDYPARSASLSTKVNLLSSGLPIVLCLALFLLSSVADAAPGAIDYRVAITGVSDTGLRNKLEEASDTVSLRKERPLFSLAQLKNRVEKDIPRLVKVLRADGYFATKVGAVIDGDGPQARVTFQVDPGPQYLLTMVEITSTDKGALVQPRLPGPEEIGLFLERAANTQEILDAEQNLLSIYKNQGFPFPEIAARNVVVNHVDRSVSVTFEINPGRPARFGHVEITGLVSVDEEMVRRKIPWHEGSRYDSRLLEDFQSRLSRTGLFAIVRIIPGSSVDDTGILPITVEVTERKQHSIGVGVSYRTDEGPGARVSWEHRNVFHNGERLTLTGGVSNITRAAEGTFRKPEFWRPDQSLRLTSRVAEDRPEAYESLNSKAAAIVERDMGNKMMAGAGIAYKIASIIQLDDEESYSLISVPMQFAWDTIDDLLDPNQGGRMAFQVAPYHDTAEAGLSFFKGEAHLSRYVKIVPNPSLVAAGRVALGGIAGADRDSIPADERFYVGGGGSIRGYAYQTVGPLEGDRPTGGRSMFEASVELRLKTSNDLGFVIFLDGGSAFEGASLDTDEQVRWGTGVGARYFTPIGPLRLDVGFPLDRRTEMDDAFQIYVSLGHSF